MMHIEVFKGRGAQPWRWHFRNKGRVTADSEGFPSKAHAIRAAKGVVRAVLAEGLAFRPQFRPLVLDKASGAFVIRWRP
jgi:uncharacterized protein YegP (UPF0339 family)